GGRVYILGNDADLCVIASDDEGESWGEVSRLTQGQAWHQSACNVHHARGRVHLVMERRVYDEVKGWPVSELAPVLMVGEESADLTLKTNWTLASELVFRDLPAAHMMGAPFWSHGAIREDGKGATMQPMGWLETNVVEFTDPAHIWHDPTGRTVYLWMRAHTGSTGLASIARVTEQDDGSWSTDLVEAPSGEPMLYMPCPGGQMRFHILQDEEGIYWLLSTMATDSMRRPECMPPERYGLPNNERHILALYFSRNCVDWCPAGIIARGDDPRQARHYASMVIDGKDLHVLSRSGDARAHSAHDGNLITLHTIPSFRELVY
ncbi:MAG: exo-alpha-sialidase, partial [Gemmatimonadetes bacterium]|nr:exo-alpha-sialidase [Gemmatimonadota bacterium]